ncbi:MAG: methionyl-tRNA formyltransferase, partial [Betaproteobacteria bacterium]|nr:methionyl-tRNA formyltransferase [Betaproteobacteria bacterium]
MRIAIIGQQDFGKAVLEAYLARGDDVAAVFCAPEKPGVPRAMVLTSTSDDRGTLR